MDELIENYNKFYIEEQMELNKEFFENIADRIQFKLQNIFFVFDNIFDQFRYVTHRIIKPEQAAIYQFGNMVFILQIHSNGVQCIDHCGRDVYLI